MFSSQIEDVWSKCQTVSRCLATLLVTMMTMLEVEEVRIYFLLFK